MAWRSLCALTLLACPWVAETALAQHPAADQAALIAAKITPDARGLLAFFRSRSLIGEQIGRVDSLLDELGDPRFKVRESASAALVELGIPVLPAMRRQSHGADPERNRRVEACIRDIERQRADLGALAMPAARELARLKPKEATEVLLTFLPFNEDEWVEEEVLTSLTEIARESSALDPVVLGYLNDPHPSRRAASGLVAGRSKEPDHRSAVRRLLQDDVPMVRLRAAQGLLAGHDKEAVPALIHLVGKAPGAVASRAEEMLFRLAGDKAPMLSASTSSASQRRNEQAWANWWRENSTRIDLTQWELDPHDLGLTLVAEMDSNQVWEFGLNGEVHWKIKDLSGPMDAHMLRNGHVLIAEYEGKRASERDLKGNVVWSHSVEGNPIASQRLNNGNTFIATHHSLMEVTPAGAEVYNRTPSKSVFLFGAQRLGNGHVVYIANPGIIEEYDPVTEKVIRSVRLGSDFGGWCSVEVLANGRFLIALFTEGKVQEVDASGKILWECRVKDACHATRLPNGNTLVASMIQKKVLEVDSAGKVIRQHDTEGRPWRVHHR
jgi:HEAT repeats